MGQFSRRRPGLRRNAASFLGACLLGTAAGVGLRLVGFLVGTALVVLGGHLVELLAGSQLLDPVYSRAAERSLLDLRIAGLAVAGLPGDWLHTYLPAQFAESARAHWALVRIVVQPGSAVMARLLASGVAHAIVLSVGIAVVRHGWQRRSLPRVLAGVAMQVQVAVSVIGAQPSLRELDSTGATFAANALLPAIAPRGMALSDTPISSWPPLQAAALVALALAIGYVPAALFLLLRRQRTRFSIATAALVLVGSAACAGVVDGSTALAGPAPAAPIAAAAPAAPVVQAPVVAAPAAPVALAPVATTTVSFDRWFAEPAAAGPSHVEVVGSNYQYTYVVNGQAQVIKGMGLNTQYAQQLSPSARAAQLDSDMAQLSALGVNTVLGWDPAEFDTVLLDAAQRHGIGVVMPFDLDPNADYTDPSVRQQLHDAVLAWVTQYRYHPAVRMWGLGNEVLHKIVHPAWVGPQDPAREAQAEAFSDWLVQTADDIHTLDADHPVTYRSAEDAFVGWVVGALNRRGGGPRPWFVWGTNCYQSYLGDIVDRWPRAGMQTALWVSEFAPGTMAVPDRPDGFNTMWGYVRRHPDWVLGGAVYAWTRNGPEGVDRNFGLTDDGTPVDGRSLDMLSSLFHVEP